MNCEICDSKLIKLKIFKKKLHKENLFGLETNKNYKRILFKCVGCNHYTNFHKFNNFLKNVYKKSYGKYSHGDIKKKFEKINTIKSKNSTNFYRCKIINSNKNFKYKKKTLLDIGAGFGIFAYKMKQMGWSTDVIEIDPNLKKFLREELKLNVIKENFLKHSFKKSYSLITFNKVLEHFDLNECKKTLNKAKKVISNNGCIYLEVPDGLNAHKNSLNRQEFFFEHKNIFSKKSLRFLLAELDFNLLYLRNVREVTGKYTIRAIINYDKKSISKI